MTITRNFSVLANGAGSANNLSLGGATLGTNALAVTGTTDISSTLNFGGFAAEGTVTAATTTNLGTSTANRQSVTGNTTITGFGTTANSYRVLRFTGTPLLTYNATSLITPTGANIQAAPGDVATLSSDGSGNWRIISYAPYGGVVDVNAGPVSCGTTGTAVCSISLSAGKWRASGVGYFVSSSQLARMGLSTTANTGAVLSGVVGKERVAWATDPAQGAGAGAIPALDFTVTTTTTIYMNCAVDASTANYYGYLRAERIF